MMKGSDQKPKWIIEFYRKSNGRYPTQEFLASIPPAHREYVIWFLKRLGRYGEDFLDRPYAGYLGDKIWELRPKTERIQYRVLRFRDGAKFVTCQGLLKKDDDVPPGEIRKAIEYRKEYFG